MPHIHQINSAALRKLDKLIKTEAVFQAKLTSTKFALNLAVEYTFLSSYKIWENFIEDVFISHARYNDPISGLRSYSYLHPTTEKHALELIKLEKDYLDWTSPDTIVDRAEILFRNAHILTNPIKSEMQDLRDAKRVRNFIAHGGKESKRLFQQTSQNRIGRKAGSAASYLLDSQIGSSNTDYYLIRYLKLFRSLVNTISR